MEIGMRFAQELKDKYCGEGRTPFFPEFMSVDTRYFYDRLTKYLFISYTDKHGREFSRDAYIYPDGTWEMTEVYPDKVIEETYRNGKVWKTERRR